MPFSKKCKEIGNTEYTIISFFKVINIGESSMWSTKIHNFGTINTWTLKVKLLWFLVCCTLVIQRALYCNGKGLKIQMLMTHVFLSLPNYYLLTPLIPLMSTPSPQSYIIKPIGTNQPAQGECTKQSSFLKYICPRGILTGNDVTLRRWGTH